MEQELLASPISPTVYNQRSQEINDAIEELGKKNAAYFEKKMGERGVHDLDDLTGKNTYEQARIDYAKTIKAFVDAYEKPPILQGEDLDRMNEQDAREFRIGAELGEMQDKQEAFRLLSEFHKQHGMAAPEQILAQRQAQQGQQPEEDPVIGGP